MDRTQPADHRQLRREFKEVMEGVKRFDSPEEVIATFTAPLVRLVGEEGLPPSLRPFAGSSIATSSSSKSDTVDVLLTESVQEALLSRIALDWTPALDSTQLTDLINTWLFAPTTHSHTQGLIQQCSLRTISRLLSSSSTQHPSTLTLLEQLCVRALTRLSLASLLASVSAERNKARADVAWTETLRLLSALPDRLANATQGRIPTGFAGKWIERVLVSGLVDCLTRPWDEVRAGRLKDVIVRLDRMGYLSRAVDTEGSGFWSTFLRVAAQEKGAAVNWARLRAKLGSALRVKLDLALVETLQYLLVVQKKLPTGLVTIEERGKAGTEGSAFLGQSSQEGVAAVTVILRTLLSDCITGNSGSTSDSSDTDDDDDSPTSRTINLFKTVALSPNQSPLLAWSWSTYLASQPSPTLLHTSLETALSRWADTTRIKRSLLTEELFLTTLIICLLASLPPSTPADTLLPAIARSRSVLDGVSSHLEHSDPTVRRLGMLVAEVLSAKTAEGGKALNFGSRMWNGQGEGREKVRVLRALSDAWDYHRGAIEGLQSKWGGGAFVEAVKGLGVKSMVGVAAEEKEQVVVRSRKVGKPKTRRLPERVEPPSRFNKSGKAARPLITMLDSDDEGDGQGKAVLRSSPPLKMFSQHRPSSRQSSSSSSTSSDDSDSDVAPASTDIHRLAASLSGLSPNSANPIIPPNPSLSHRKPSHPSPPSSITDFETNPESHAPQFHTKTPTPIYISQLSPLLRSSSRSDIRLALHTAAPLIQRKTSPLFGGEIAEIAVDLCLTLIALHDNFGIRGFERMRRDAVCALAVAAPKVVVGVCGARVQRVGEEGVAEMRRERQLQVNAKWVGGGKRVVEMVDPSTTAERRKVVDEWSQIAGEVFIFPLLNRFLAYQTYHSSTRHRGSGTSALFNPPTQAIFLDTLTILLSLSPPQTLFQAAPSLLELLSSTTSTTATTSSALTCSTLTLLALVLERSLENPTPLLLLLRGECGKWLGVLLEFTQEVFRSKEGKGGVEEGGGLGRKVLARAAAVLLLMERVEQAREEEVRKLVGFVA